MTEPKFPYLKEVTIRNLKSFGPEAPTVELGPLNILIGANGSGKSNFLSCIKIMSNSIGDFGNLFAKIGMDNWVWKGVNQNSIEKEISIELAISSKQEIFKHFIEFKNVNNLQIIKKEEISRTFFHEIVKDVLAFEYSRNGNESSTNVPDGIDLREIHFPYISENNSVLSLYSDPTNFWEFALLQNIYRNSYYWTDWKFGENNELSQRQSINLPSNKLLTDASNLAVFFDKLLEEKPIKAKILEYLKEFYEPFNDEFRIRTQNGGLEMVIEERDFERPIPHFMLSDGTQRFFFLLALLLDPTPPPLICIEEPELGMHPDVIPLIAKLLKDASTRTQVIVTTHSEQLVDEFGEEPECIQVCERYNGSTTITRLNKEDLKSWLEKYSLGHLWVKGHIGGNRW